MENWLNRLVLRRILTLLFLKFSIFPQIVLAMPLDEINLARSYIGYTEQLNETRDRIRRNKINTINQWNNELDRMVQWCMKTSANELRSLRIRITNGDGMYLGVLPSVDELSDLSIKINSTIEARIQGNKC